MIRNHHRFDMKAWLAKAPIRITALTDSSALSRQGVRRTDWVILGLLVLLACVVRLIFYTGPMGSDDVIYTQMAVAILHGDWSVGNYVGALRYGINLPVAALMALFGTSEFNANLWALLCALGEVATVFVLARSLWGRSAAVLAALVLALLPLHVNTSGRLLADTPLTFFTTLCFALFFYAERGRGRALYLAAGLALGAVYWIEESVAVLVLPVFLVYALAVYTFRREWIWTMAGALAMLALNLELMWWISGDPWLVFRATSGSVHKLDTRTDAQTSPAYYFRYLFLDGRHTWLMPFLTVGGIWAWWRSKPVRDGNTGYIVLWALGLLLILSFAVVSFSPFRFIPKQTNYMQIFSAPFSLLAGYWLASRLRRRWAVAAMLLLVAGSLLLSAMEQQGIRVFVANSRAALAFQAAHPDVPVYCSVQAENLSSMLSALDGNWPSRPAIRPLTEASNGRVFATTSGGPSDGTTPCSYPIVDLETLSWGNTGEARGSDVPACWRQKEVLVPQGFGFGREVLRILRNLAAIVMPEGLARKASQATDPYYAPRPATVYEIPTACALRPQVS